ncbi:Major fimbrial subunit precursor [compost metagenome]
MKKIILITSLFTVMAGANSAGAATINFSGKITDVSCTATVSNGTGADITLPVVSKDDLKNSGDTAGNTPFTINLSTCKQAGTALSGTLPKASIYFEPGQYVNAVSGRLINSGKGIDDAKNVELEILDGGTNGNPIKLGSSEQLVSKTETQLLAGTTQLNYAVRYYATGVATAGAVKSSVVYDISYN